MTWKVMQRLVRKLVLLKEILIDKVTAALSALFYSLFAIIHVRVLSFHAA